MKDTKARRDYFFMLEVGWPVNLPRDYMMAKI